MVFIDICGIFRVNCFLKSSFFGGVSMLRVEFFIERFFELLLFRMIDFRFVYSVFNRLDVGCVLDFVFVYWIGDCCLFIEFEIILLFVMLLFKFIEDCLTLWLDSWDRFGKCLFIIFFRNFIDGMLRLLFWLAL